MIKLIKTKSYIGDVYLNPAFIAAIDFQDKDAYVRAGDTDYRMSHDSALALIAELQGISSPSVNANSLVLTTLATIKRDETKNNRRPMWRCVTVEGEKVNVFLNEDEPAKDSFHLFQEANWGNFLEDIPDYSEVDSFIVVAMQKNGQWWEIVKVMPRIEALSNADEFGGENETD